MLQGAMLGLLLQTDSFPRLCFHGLMVMVKQQSNGARQGLWIGIRA